MVDQGIFTKITYNERLLKVEYELTELGKSLIPTIKSTAQWGEDHREELEKLIIINI